MQSNLNTILLFCDFGLTWHFIFSASPSYLWILDDNGLPTSYKMWVNIIPIGGVAFSWEKWSTLPTGAQISTFHDGAMLNVDITNLNAGNSIEALGLATDPFTVLAN